MTATLGLAAPATTAASAEIAGVAGDATAHARSGRALDVGANDLAGLLADSTGGSGMAHHRQRYYGIGNASVILHVTRNLINSPKPASYPALQLTCLHEAMASVLSDAVRPGGASLLQRGDVLKLIRPAVCGDTVREVSFMDKSLLSTCQTDWQGRPIAAAQVVDMLTR